MAYGLPAEGEDGPFLGEFLSEVPTCDVGQTVGTARQLLERTEDEEVIVVAGDRMAVGKVDAKVLGGHDDDAGLLDVMDPVPSTYRPSVSLAEIAEDGGGRRLVSTPDGRLLGVTTIDAQDHDHEQGEVDTDAFERELAAVMEGIGERFGDREPSAAELRSFLHERLVAEGRSAEEADQFLDALESGEED